MRRYSITSEIDWSRSTPPAPAAGVSRNRGSPAFSEPVTRVMGPTRHREGGFEARPGACSAFRTLPVIRLRRRYQQGSTHIPSGHSASQPMRFRAKLTGS